MQLNSVNPATNPSIRAKLYHRAPLGQELIRFSNIVSTLGKEGLTLCLGSKVFFAPVAPLEKALQSFHQALDVLCRGKISGELLADCGLFRMRFIREEDFLSWYCEGLSGRIEIDAVARLLSSSWIEGWYTQGGTSKKILEVIRGGMELDKRKGIFLLGEVSSSDSVPFLLQTLYEDRYSIEAAEALGSMRTEAAVMPLVKIIQQNQERLDYQKPSLIISLDKIPVSSENMQAVLDVLLDLLSIESSATNEKIMNAAERALPRIVKQIFLAGQGLACLAHLQDILHLRNSDRLIRVIATVAGDAIINHFSSVLDARNCSTQSRINAAIILGLTEHVSAIPVLQRILRQEECFLGDIFNENVLLRETIKALGNLRALEIFSNLSKLLDRQNLSPYLYKEIVVALGKIGTSTAIAILKNELIKENNYNDLCYSAIAKALGEITQKEDIPLAVQLLLSIMQGEKGIFDAVVSLGRLNYPHELVIDCLAKEAEKPRDQESYWIQVQWEAIRALAKMGGEKAEATLLNIIVQGTCNVQKTIDLFREMDLTGTNTVANIIEGLFKVDKKGKTVREAHSQLFSGLMVRESFQARIVVGLSESIIEEIRCMLIEKMGEMGVTQITDSLIEMLNKKESNKVKSSAIRALGNLGEARAILPLIDLLNNPNTEKKLKELACEALAQIGGEKSFEILFDLVKSDQDKDLRFKAAEALGKAGANDHLNNLLNYCNFSKPEKKIEIHFLAAWGLYHLRLNELTLEALATLEAAQTFGQRMRRKKEELESVLFND